MNIVFAGTPPFAALALDAILGAGHTVRLVLTQPDRPAGRGRQPQPSAVKRLAQQQRLALLQPASLKDEALAAAIARTEPEAMVVAAYGLIVPRALLALPRRGGLNIHASLLPRWRGAAPIQRALLAGDANTGITIMQMDEGLDTGAILLQEATPIGPEETAGSVHDRLALLGAQLIVRALAEAPAPRPQPHEGVTYAEKVEKNEARIDWRDSAEAIGRKVRAFNPVPGAATVLDGTPLKIWSARVEANVAGTPGAVLEAGATGLLVACGSGGLRLTELQRAGGKRLPAPAFLAGTPVARGARMG